MLTVIVSFLVAILAGLGVGSGGLMVVFFTAVSSLPQLDAQLLNLIFFASSSIAALGVNLFKKRLSFPLILSLSIPGCIFAVGASLIARDIDSETLGKTFGALLITMGIISLSSSLKGAKIREKRPK